MRYLSSNPKSSSIKTPFTTIGLLVLASITIAVILSPLLFIGAICNVLSPIYRNTGNATAGVNMFTERFLA